MFLSQLQPTLVSLCLSFLDPSNGNKRSLSLKGLVIRMKGRLRQSSMGWCFPMAAQHYLLHHYYYDTKDWLETSQGAGSQVALTSLSQ